MSDLDRAKELLRRPRDLTIEEWREAARIVREGNLRRLRAVGGTYRDPDLADVGPAYGYDWPTGTYYVERVSGPGWTAGRARGVR